MNRGSVAGITPADAFLIEVARGSPAALYQFRRDPSGELHLSFVSARFARMFGIEPGESKATAALFFARIHPDDVGSIVEVIDHSAATLSPFGREFRYRMPTGSEIWFEACSNPERDADGGTVWNGIATDITKRKRAEDIREATYLISEAATNERDLDDFFKRSREILGALIPAHNFYVALIDRESETLTFPYFVDEVEPPPAKTPLGRGLTEYVIRTGEPLLAPLEVFDDLVARGEVVSVGAPSVDWLGAPLKAFGKIVGAVVVQSYAAEVRFKDSDKDVLSFVSNQLAIAIERKRAEKALRQSEASLSEAQHLTHVGSWQWDLVSNTVTWSEEMYPIFGFTHETFDGKTESLLRVVHPEDRHRFVERMEDNRFRGIASPLEYRVIRPDGEERTVYAQGTIVCDDSGVPVKSTGTVQDVTERRQLEAQLRQSQKMEAIGRLAGGVAHDFNNMLAVILGFGELALGKTEPGSSLHSDLSEIVGAAQRSADLTRQLLAFARRQTVSPRAVDLNAVLGSLRKIVGRLVGEDIAVSVVPGPGLWLVRIDPTQVDQIVANLAANARDAIADVGTIRLATANVSLGTKREKGYEVSAGDYVALTVSDDGAGMDEETKEHIFEPFFTTKERGKGTGLGLATVYGIVKQNGGFIDIASEPGSGTSFTILLPRFVGSAEPLAETKDAGTKGGLETILIVEDEPQVLDLAKKGLERSGYTVLTAGSPAAAITLCREYPGPIHVLVTDVVMPLMNGRDLNARLRETRPDLRTVFMSGYTANVMADRGLMEEGFLFLQKPFALDALAARVREALGS